MKLMNLKLLLMTLITIESFTSCGKDDIDMSNIENLYEQPLDVIQKAVQGKWQWVSTSSLGFIGFRAYNNTFVEITENNVVVTPLSDGWPDSELANFGSFFYEWEKKETTASYTTYVMWDCKKNNGWYFDKIQNDTLIVLCDDVLCDDIFTSYALRYTFVKIK